MTEDQKGRDVLERLLREIATGIASGPHPNVTERMRAALALAELDNSVSATMRASIREIINGFGNRAS